MKDLSQVKKKPEAATSGLKKFRRYVNNRNKLNDVIRDLVLHHFPVICKTGGKKFYIWFGFNADNVAIMFVSAGDVGGARDIAATLVNNWVINNAVEKQRKNTDIAKMEKKRVEKQKDDGDRAYRQAKTRKIRTLGKKNNYYYYRQNKTILPLFLSIKEIEQRHLRAGKKIMVEKNQQKDIKKHVIFVALRE